MKVTAILVASAFVLGASASAAAEACNQEGQACYQIKRAAEAAAEALAAPNAEPCTAAGCDLVKRAEDDLLAKLNEVSDAYSNDKEIKDVFIEKREPGKYNFSPAFCGRVRGLPCHKLKRAAEAIAEAMPEAGKYNFSPAFCGRVRGLPCHKKRALYNKARSDHEALSAFANSLAADE